MRDLVPDAGLGSGYGPAVAQPGAPGRADGRIGLGLNPHDPDRMTQTVASATSTKLEWQSKLVLLAVVPAAATDAALRGQWWAARTWQTAVWALGLSALLGLITWKLRAATAAAAVTGAIITESLIFSTLSFPYEPWRTALIPVLAVSLVAFAATRVGRAKKERLGTAEARQGRAAAQIAANLGVATVIASEFAQSWAVDSGWFSHATPPAVTGIAEPLFTAALAALAEAAADTVSSELGQVFGGRPRLILGFRAVEPGEDGAVSLAGTLAGVAAAGAIAGVGAWALRGGSTMFAVSCAGGVAGLFFDSLLGATLERCGWLNNDAVNFLSTAAAAIAALVFFVVAR
jgi:uncharacterized protein (TIGR00297 family)